MNNDFLKETMKLEGERFLLMKQIDKCHSIYDYPHLTNKLNQLNEKIDQYHKVIEAFRTMKPRKIE